MRGLVPASIRQNVFGTLGRFYPKADWAPRPLRAKTTLLALAEDGAGGLCPLGRRHYACLARRALLRRCPRSTRRPPCRGPLRSIDAQRPGARRARPRAICRFPALAARRHPHQSRSHQHGSRARSARAVARLSFGRIRSEASGEDAAEGRAGEVAAEKSDGALSPQGHSLPPENGVRDPDQRLVSGTACGRSRRTRQVTRSPRAPAGSTPPRSRASPTTTARAAPITVARCGNW